MKWFYRSGVLASLCLVACSVEAPDSSMGDVSSMAPGQWSATKQAKAGVDEQWVKRFGDRRLSQLVNESLANNQDMRIASERVYRAGEAANIAGAASRPMARAVANADNQKLNFVGFPFGGSDVVDTYGVNLNVEWEPDIWGRVRTGQSAALAEWQAGGSEYRAARASLAAQVCKAWFALAEAREQVTLANEALEIRKKTELAVRERFEMSMQAEGGSASQLRLAQTDVATAKADLSSRMGTLESARRQLELLAGRYPSARLEGRAKLPSAPSSPPAGLPSELLLRRPDILAAERRYASSIKRVKEAQLAAFPSFKLTGSVGSSTDALSNIVNSNYGVWSLGASATQWLLTGGQVRSEIRLRKSNQREALSNLHQTVLRAFGEVEQALAAERWLMRREQEIYEALKLAKEASSAAEDDYRDGNGDVLTLFVAQSRRIQLDSTYASLRRLRLTNRVDLHLALGGGFSLR
ncbi:efflux transporter outer membrane subunit [Verrucomicrobiaceae bacterium N1E253]|uniref:Efflux transporter outer membrane subunit n=1 Tax=Oceaniferula marina TaxID=2748318 RepID=A0A851GFM1_9BACT|nr:efflux transporter outer membrane subunit [Oceaniferula marina]NWK54561.1 efflux transporter outer membrane subunit [Oceaniferula marina]